MLQAVSILFVVALACVALTAQVAQADCSDRSYDCVLKANVRYDSISKTYTAVTTRSLEDSLLHAFDAMMLILHHIKDIFQCARHHALLQVFMTRCSLCNRQTLLQRHASS